MKNEKLVKSCTLSYLLVESFPTEHEYFELCIALTSHLLFTHCVPERDVYRAPFIAGRPSESLGTFR